jgi:adenylate cyclase
VSKRADGPKTDSESAERASDPATQLGIDPTHLYDVIEGAILGSARSLNRVQVTEAAGVPLERATSLWQALGFPATQSDDEVLFVDADIEAMKQVSWLIETGFIDPDIELTLVRSMGRSFARLAEWEISELASSAMTASTVSDEGRLEELLNKLIPVVEDLQNYVWRRHIANAAGRILLQPGGEEGVEMAVGFADIVGFTRRSRGLSSQELTQLVEIFEGSSATIVTAHNGRIIKTIGDEVLFVCDDPVDAARIGLELTEGSERDDSFPELRVGLAYGDVVSRMGDVFGPVVNIASRLTSLARPGRVLVDRELGKILKPKDSEFRVRRARTTTVRGYSRLETWSLKRPKDAKEVPHPLEGRDPGHSRAGEESLHRHRTQR